MQYTRIMAYGMLIFRSLSEALKAGFELYDRTADGYVANEDRWPLADGAGQVLRRRT
jgi:Ca2+-binding EF-hand superfamily protein